MKDISKIFKWDVYNGYSDSKKLNIKSNTKLLVSRHDANCGGVCCSDCCLDNHLIGCHCYMLWNNDEDVKRTVKLRIVRQLYRMLNNVNGECVVLSHKKIIDIEV